MGAPLVDLAARSMSLVGAHLELDLLGTTDPDEVASAIAAACRPLGEVHEGRFYEVGVGLVVGVQLDSDMAVVFKLHWFNATSERLTACLEVQAHLHDAGLPAPRPLLPVLAIGSGFATVEELRTGAIADGRDPLVRRALATELHRLVEAARPLGRDVALDPLWLPASADDPLWATPHDLRFDFEATAAGAEWIDELAKAANERRRRDDGDLVIGHLDWRVQNLAFEGTRVVAIYDWDSLGLASEPAIVGQAAGGFPIDWRAGHPDPPPTVDEMRAFVGDYERARGAPFTATELDALDAANLTMIAYGARCQHSDQQLRPDLGDNRAIGWPRLLRERGERCFDTAP
ncbi:MAG: hypothetical protein ABWZ52_12475 [Acidimicrobiales bacterium]